MKRIVLVLFGILLVAGCATAPSRHATGTFVPEEDEKRLWHAAEQAEKSIDDSGLVYRDPELRRYLTSVLGKLLPPETLVALPITTDVIRMPFPNAMAFPNGRIFITEGMLVHMENEAQLAVLLGHETTHVFRRHAMQELRNTKSKTAIFATINSLTINLLAPLGRVGAQVLTLSYSRDLEREADREGLQLVINAGYDPVEAPQLFTILQLEAKEEKREESTLFATHPHLQERIASYRELMATTYATRKGGATNAEAFRRAISPLYLDNSRLDLKRGSFEAARRVLQKFIVAKGDDAKAEYLLGETWRQSGQKDWETNARIHYGKATNLDPAYPDAHRALGMIAYKKKEWELSRRSLERYVALAPEAPDRAYIEQMLKNLH